MHLIPYCSSADVKQTGVHHYTNASKRKPLISYRCHAQTLYLHSSPWFYSACFHKSRLHFINQDCHTKALPVPKLVLCPADDRVYSLFYKQRFFTRSRKKQKGERFRASEVSTRRPRRCCRWHLSAAGADLRAHHK